MRPKIAAVRHLRRSIAYNEQKVTTGAAERLAAGNFLKEVPDLTAADMQRRIQRRMELNARVTTSLHITLNFDPQDELSNYRMERIARTYMQEIGFGRQPWVAWRHEDAGHPHCHIVTTHVREDGDPIDLYNIGRNQSERARANIEAEFHLITAETKKEQRQVQRRLPDDELRAPRPLIYGEQPLARGISGIVEYVAEKYRYTSLEEFNLALRPYNVEADAGTPGTKLYQDRGLLYRALDKDGHYIGRPLKASFFDTHPTLENLEEKFAQNLVQKLEHRQRLETAVMWELYIHPDDWDRVSATLERQDIQPHLTLDKTGRCESVSYLDTEHHIVYRADELDQRCNARAVQDAIDAQKVRESQEQRLDQHQRQVRQHRLRIGM